MTAFKAAATAGQHLSSSLAEDKNVVGVGVVRGPRGFKLRLSVLRADRQLPKSVSGIPVTVEIVEKRPRAQGAGSSPTSSTAVPDAAAKPIKKVISAAPTSATAGSEGKTDPAPAKRRRVSAAADRRAATG